MRRLLPLLWLCLVAARTPEPGAVDPHIQTVMYAPDDVVLLQGALGWQIMIEFGPDERIENVSIGDALAWQVTPNKRAQNLFLKPLIKDAATNMTVVTDRRRYAFALATTPRRSTTPWVVKFEYPAEIVIAYEEPLPPPPPPLNFAYRMSGDAELLPLRVWDDGELTYFEFGAHQAIPAIFAGSPKTRNESLVNSMMRDRVAIVHQTSGHFTLRIGERMATVTWEGTQQ